MKTQISSVHVTLCLSVFALSLVALPFNASAACAPTHNANGVLARAIGAASLSGCTGTNAVKVGAAVSCQRVIHGPTYTITTFIAAWLSSAARTGDASGGCRFPCAGGQTCFVGNDGLPVELLGFRVE